MPEENGTTTAANGSSNLEIAQSNQDLIISKSRRKKRNWIIACVASAIVLALVIAAIVLLTRRDSSEPAVGTPEALTLEDFLNFKYNPKSFNATWASGNQLLYSDANGHLVLLNLASNTSSILMNSNDSISLTAFEFRLSADGLYLLIAHDYQKLYRHSYKAKYTIQNINTGERTVLQAGDNQLDLQLVVWSPEGNALVLVYNSNIYYKSTATSDSIVQITTASGPYVQYGIPDWVYEEEVFSSNKALWFSPDGKKLTYARFDDTSVPLMVVPIYGEPGSLVFQYPRANLIKYPKKTSTGYRTFRYNSSGFLLRRLVAVLPRSEGTDRMISGTLATTSNHSTQEQSRRIVPKSIPMVRSIVKAGTTNPTVSLHVVDLDTPTVIGELVAPTALQNLQPILATVAWATNQTVTAVWMNRVQNIANIMVYQTTTPYTSTVVREINQTSGWIELFTEPKISNDGTRMLLLLSQDQGNNLGSFRHLTMVEISESGATQALTSGAYVVTEILSWDTENNLIYYMANMATDYSVQHLYSVSPDTRETKCISCDLRSRHNTSLPCSYVTAEFSPDSSYYVLTCAGPDVPQVNLYRRDGSLRLDWHSNDELAQMVSGKQIPTKVKFEFEIADGFKAHAMLKLPPNMDYSGNTKYPMLVNVYGGPDTYQVVDKFGLDWGSYLASNKSIIYAVIDGRGSGLKGDKIMFSGYRKLGTVEVTDQINVTRILQQNLSYIDSSRTAIWGWSYGGYAAGMALATDTEGIFKCGISVAPVTDWALYDSIYTERFMGLPTIDDNYQGYYEAQLLTKYAGLKDKDYFLIHGTFDDNVHYQQSMMWAKMLERNDILFRQLSYTDEDHGLGSVRPHLYHSLEDFLDECFVKTE